MKALKPLKWESLLLVGTVLILAGTVLTMVSGCTPKQAHARRDPIQPAAMRDELPSANGDSNRYLVNVKFFLWPEDMGSHSPVVSETLNLAKNIDDLDTASFLLAKEKTALEKTLKPWTDADATANASQRKVDLTQRMLNTELARATPDQAKVDRLQAQLAQQTAKRDADRAEADRQLQLVDPVRAGESIGPKRARLAETAKIQASYQEQGTQQVDEITKLVYWYKTQPSSVALGFVQNPKTGALEPTVRINEWALFKDGEPQLDKHSYDSSTDVATDSDGNLKDDGTAGTITNVSYQSRGSVFRFDLGVFASPVVPLTDEEAANPALARARAIRDAMNGNWVTELQEVYSFRFGRIRYDKTEDPNDGRLFYGGEINRRRDPNGPYCQGYELDVLNCLRQGSAKLVDRNS